MGFSWRGALTGAGVGLLAGVFLVAASSIRRGIDLGAGGIGGPESAIDPLADVAPAQRLTAIAHAQAVLGHSEAALGIVNQMENPAFIAEALPQVFDVILRRADVQDEKPALLTMLGDLQRKLNADQTARNARASTDQKPDLLLLEEAKVLTECGKIYAVLDEPRLAQDALQRAEDRTMRYRDMLRVERGRSDRESPGNAASMPAGSPGAGLLVWPAICSLATFVVCGLITPVLEGIGRVTIGRGVAEALRNQDLRREFDVGSD